MSENNKQFGRTGLGWKGFIEGESLWDIYNNEQYYEFIDEPTKLDKLTEIFNEFGNLQILDRELFMQTFNCRELIEDIPDELLKTVLFQVLLGINGVQQFTKLTMAVYCDWDEVRNILELKESKTIKEQYLEGYAIKKIFDAEGTENQVEKNILEDLNNLQIKFEKIFIQMVNKVASTLIEHCEQPTDPFC